jgi:hypothetical protein
VGKTPNANAISVVTRAAKKCVETGSSAPLRNITLLAAEVIAWMDDNRERLIATIERADKRNNELEETIRGLRNPPGVHAEHLPKPPRHVGAFDTMRGMLPRATIAGEVLSPARRATPWRKPIAGIDE